MKKWMLRLSMLLAFCIVWSGLVGFKSASHNLAPDSKQSELSVVQLIELINKVRTQHGLSSLITDEILMSTAQATADVMASRSMMDPIGDVREIALAAGYGNGGTAWVRENIACLPPEAGAKGVLAAWADAENQVVMADPVYQHIGAGVAVSGSGEVYYIVQAAYTDNQNYDPNQPSSGQPPVADLIAHAISKMQANGASDNLSQIALEPTLTESPIIPGTGHKVGSSVITSLTVVAIIGISLVGLALFLKN
jgi:hypothetical protein